MGSGNFHARLIDNSHSMGKFLLDRWKISFGSEVESYLRRDGEKEDTEREGITAVRRRAEHAQAST